MGSKNPNVSVGCRIQISLLHLCVSFAEVVGFIEVVFPTFSPFITLITLYNTCDVIKSNQFNFPISDTPCLMKMLNHVILYEFPFLVGHARRKTTPFSRDSQRSYEKANNFYFLFHVKLKKRCQLDQECDFDNARKTRKAMSYIECVQRQK
jgi:hypothetical protein